MLRPSSRLLSLVSGLSVALFACGDSDPDAPGGDAAQDTPDATEPDATEPDATEPDAASDALVPTVKSPEAACAEIARCTGTNQNYGLQSCPSRVRAVEAFRARAAETRETSTLLLVARFDCLLAAEGDCAAVDACLNPPGIPENVCAGQEGYHEVCSGEVAVACPFSGTPSFEDCGAAGLTCVSHEDRARCSEPVPCAAATCDGDVVVWCEDQIVTLTDCRGRITVGCSGACKTDVTDTCALVSGGARCQATGAECDGADFADGCDGDVLQTCTHGKVGTRDCATIGPGMTCHRADGFDYFFCAPSATACNGDAAQTCTDGVIAYCLDGEPATFDCAEIGASGCEVRTGTSGLVFGVCAPE